MPFSSPGLWKQLPWMLTSDLSPLRLPLRHLHHSLPWLVRFLAAGSSRAKVSRHAEAMAPLMKRTVQEHRSLMNHHGVDPLLVRPSGWLSVYKDKNEVDLNDQSFELFRRHEMDVDIVEDDELFQLEPSLSRQFRVGVLNKDDSFAVQPIALSQAYFDAFLASGGEIRSETARDFELGPEGARKLITDLGIHPFDKLVVTTGAWSKRLVKRLGLRIPVEAERGYHVNVPWPDGITLNRPVFVADGYYVLCPMRDGVRITSGAEFGGVDLAPDFRRIRRLLTHARTSLPGLVGEPDREWMGYRPSLPDSRPVIGRVPHLRNVFLAFGHGHLGLTLSAITAQVISELLSDGKSEFDLSAFRIERF